MDSLSLALERVTADIERLQPQLERLQQDMERLKQHQAMLLGAKEPIHQLLAGDTDSDHPRHGAMPEPQEPIIDASVKILQAQSRSMGPAEILAELERSGRQVDYNVLSSLLSRESNKPGGRIRRVSTGSYVTATAEMSAKAGDTGGVSSGEDSTRTAIASPDATAMEGMHPSGQAMM